MESNVSLFTLRGYVTRSSEEKSVLMANARTDILTNVETTKQTMDVLGEFNEFPHDTPNAAEPS